MNLKITTFNVENLFNRYAFLDKAWNDRDYEDYIQAVGLASLSGRQGGLVSYEVTNIQRNNTAQAILDMEPDILAIQEIENLYTLRIFNNVYLDNYFEKMISILGNDSRGINVGLAVKKGVNAEILNIRTNADEGVIERVSQPNNGYRAKGAIFSRDCLEVDIKVNDKILTFLVNHFKSQDGRDTSIEKRKKQADRVVKIVEKLDKEGKYPIVIGDLNVDLNNPQTPGDNSIASLLNCPILADSFPEGTWTHYYVPEKKVTRLDYILTHKNLNVIGNEINRKGLTTKCRQYNGERYATIGPEHTEASDHCPTSIILDI